MHFSFKDHVKCFLRSLIHIIQLIIDTMMHYVIVADFHVGFVFIISTKLANVQDVFYSLDLGHNTVVNQVDMAKTLIENIYITRNAASSLLFTVCVQRYLAVLHVRGVGGWLVFVVVQLLLGVGVELFQQRDVIELFFEAAAVGGDGDLAREVLTVN